MQYLSIPKLLPALEEMEQLLTEISQEPLVEAEDVCEELTNELDGLQSTRDTIVDSGMDQNTANVISEAVEGFLMRNPMREFTHSRSIEGIGVALEEIDDKRQNVLQRLWQWLVNKLQSVSQWLQRLFGKDGKGEQALDSAKAMAEDVQNNRKPDNVSKMAKDPAAADQEARIEPQGPKSGKYEDFVEKHKQYAEPLQAEWAQILEKIRADKILSTICVSPESVNSFFTHMEQVQSKTQQIHTLIDKAANAVRSNHPVEQLVQEVGQIRQEIYKLFGGEDESVLESIRQQVFTEQTSTKFESIDYDELVPLMTKVVSNMPAANAEQRIRELDQLSKAVKNFEGIANTNVFKRIDPTQRNALLSSMQGLTQDVVKFVSSFTQDWTLVLKIYTGVNSFFQQERSFYYKTIASIQKAASEVFEESDRNALYENFKHMGFSMDLTPEDMRRRGVGTESLQDVLDGLDAALESMDVPYPGPVPVYGNIFGSGLMAALEAEENLEDKEGFLTKIKEWFKRFVNWVKSFFVKKLQAADQKVEAIVEKKNEAVKKESAFRTQQPSIRPEVQAHFDKMFADTGWYAKQPGRESVDQFYASAQASLYNALAHGQGGDIEQLVRKITDANTKLWLSLKAVDDASTLINIAAGVNMQEINKGFEEFQAYLGKKHSPPQSLKEAGELITVAVQKSALLKSVRWVTFETMVEDSMGKIDSLLGMGKFGNAQPMAVQDAAKKLQGAVNSIVILSNMMTYTLGQVYFPTYLKKAEFLQAMFEGESKLPPTQGELHDLSMDVRWNPPVKL